MKPAAAARDVPTILPVILSSTVWSILACLPCAVPKARAADAPATPIRAGMIGLDTSHVPKFTELFNNAKPDGELGGVRVVAGYPGGTDLPLSRDRVAKFTEQVRGMGVEIVDSIPALLDKVDVVLLESVDGRIHLQEAKQVIMAGKPLFIDKPLAGSLADGIAILDLAKRQGVPCFSCSSMRFGPGIKDLRDDASVGEIVGAAVWGPCPYQEGTADLLFYGIHGVETLFTLMGAGCETVSRIQTDDTDAVTGTWTNGRLGTFRGLRRHNAQYGTVAFGTKGIATSTKIDGGYEPLCREIATFFKTRRSPVPAEETIEILAFIEAADESARQGGRAVAVADVLAKARAAAAERR
jgi:predicted dehydrogenase